MSDMTMPVISTNSQGQARLETYICETYISGRTHNDNRIHQAYSISTQLNKHQETFFLLVLILLYKNASTSS